MIIVVFNYIIACFPTTMQPFILTVTADLNLSVYSTNTHTPQLSEQQQQLVINSSSFTGFSKNHIKQKQIHRLYFKEFLFYWYEN